jgi:hypothetical protein
MRKLATFLAAVILASNFHAAVAQQTLPNPGSTLEEDDDCGRDHLGDAVLCDPEDLDITYSVAPSQDGSGSLIYVSAGTGKRYYAYDRLLSGPDGQGCVTTGYAEEGTTPTDGVRTDLVTQNVLDIHGLPLEFPPCPEQPRVPGQPAPIETPSMVARRLWERVPLPKPQPLIAPGRAITGKPAYLETRGQVGYTFTTDTVFGQLVIVATGSYVVDWGDGEKSGPHSFEGKPWPDGRITHDYLNVGSYDVIVTERWTATWRLGGESGILRTLQTTGRIDDFPVQQIQAVVR